MTPTLDGPAAIAWALAGSAVAAATAVAIVRAERRERRAGAGRRVAATLVALTALLYLGLPLRWRGRAPAGEIAIVTPGASLAQRRAAERELGASRAISLATHDLGQIRRRFPGLAKVRVVGWGMTEDEWAELGAVAATLDSAPAPAGFARVAWAERPRVGERFTVRGTAVGAGRPRWVVLEDPGGVADSVALDGDSTFALTARPVATGRWTYALRLSPAVRGFAVESLGVEVVRPEPVSVIVLQASPSFETRYLKEWLGRRGAPLAVRTRVSRGRYRYETVNRPAAALTSVTPELLRGADVVVTDGATLAELVAPERAALRDAVERDGLGVLVVADDALLGGRRIEGRAFYVDAVAAPIPGLEDRVVRPRWPGGRPSPTAVPAAAFDLRAGATAGSLAVDEAGRTLAVMGPRGAGRTAVSLVTGPSRWMLAGDAEGFGAWWELLLGRLAERSRRVPHLAAASAAPRRVDRAVTLELDGPGAPRIATVTAPDRGLDSVFLSSPVGDSAHASGRYWPAEPGWYRIAAGSASAAFRVESRTAWRAADAVERRDASRRALATAPASLARTAAVELVERQPARWPAFLALVAATAYLWAGSRRRATSGSAPPPSARSTPERLPSASA